MLYDELEGRRGGLCDILADRCMSLYDNTNLRFVMTGSGVRVPLAAPFSYNRKLVETVTERIPVQSGIVLVHVRTIRSTMKLAVVTPWLCSR